MKFAFLSSIPLATLAIASLVGSPNAAAANFCASTGAQLTNALATARSNGENDTIKMVEGTFTSAAGSNAMQWSYMPNESDAFTSITVIGGYESGCVTVDPPNGAAATVLDAQNNGEVFVFLSSSIAEFGGQVILKNFTATRGRGRLSGFASAITMNTQNTSPLARIELERTLVVASTSTAASIRGSVLMTIGSTGSMRVKGNIIHDNWVTGSFSNPGLELMASGSAFGIVTNNTIYRNTSTRAGSGLLLCGPLNVSNNVVAQNDPSGWSNTAAQVYSATGDCTSGLDLRNNHFENYYWTGTPATNQSTTDGNPLWTISGDYPAAQAVSPLRDSGINNPLSGLTSVDIRGNARIVNGTVDRGAVEAAVVPATGPTISAIWPIPNQPNSLGTATPGSTVQAQMTFQASGGSQGSTTLTCTSDTSALQITSNGAQTVVAGQPVLPVSIAYGPVVMGLQQASISCAISPQGGSPYSLVYGVNVVGASDALFKNGFD